MNRKEAMKKDRCTRESWLNGYKYMQQYKAKRLTREDFMWLISEDLLDAEVRKPTGWHPAWFYGRVAAMKNFLKKGAYAR